jgi:predicted N-acetyltransferase YhbS
MKSQALYRLRPLAADDAGEVAALIRHAFAAQSVVTDPLPSALKETAGSVATTLSAGGGAGAFAGDMIVGAVLWQAREGSLYLGRLSVRVGWRGVGIARALVAATEDEARRLGLGKVILSTRLVLADNRLLFAACGFRETTQHAHPGYAMPTFVDMEKSLA